MPYRAYHLVLGIAGVAAVVLLVILRTNVDHQARTGPRWKQRLLVAGIMLLAAFGMGPACKGGGTPKSSPSSAMGAGANAAGMGAGARPAAGSRPAAMAGAQGMTPPKAAGHYTDLARSSEWTQITAVTNRAEAIAANKKGAYPFNRAGRKKLLGDLQTAQSNADALAKRKLITPGEAALLKTDLQNLARKVSAFRPTEMRMATCYEPMPMSIPASHSLKRLQARLPILKKLAAAKRLHPRVLAKVLTKVESDVRILEDPAQRGRLSVSKQATAKKLAASARAELVKIKALLKRASTTKSTTKGK